MNASSIQARRELVAQQRCGLVELRVVSSGEPEEKLVSCTSSAEGNISGAEFVRIQCRSLERSDRADVIAAAE